MKQLAPKLWSWASILDEQTLAQAERTSRMPFVYPHVALMPDAHLGKGATVGSVIPTYRAIMPAAVGVDIGCGMVAFRTQANVTVDRLCSHTRSLDELRTMIEDNVPLSAGKYNQHLWHDRTAARISLLSENAHKFGFDPADYAANWDMQLGSLGSGNHFIEICSDENDRVWIFLHSGSRGVGNKIAQRHIKIAQHATKQLGTPLEDPDLAYLIEGTPEFARYTAELTWAQLFAYQNREEMLMRVVWCLEVWLGTKISSEVIVRCHHNYTMREEHYGRAVWVSRKGAISARRGELGIIPGSMGAMSYVVRGLGDDTALHSAPHGAGRVLSRNQAKRTLDVNELRDRMSAWGVTWNADKAMTFLDEHPDAYKPIDQVMSDAVCLVEPVHALHQVINVKGD